MTQDDPLLDVAADLRAIRDMHADLPTQAAHKATARLSGDQLPLPGGLAMVCLGPVADLSAVERRCELAEAAWLASHDALHATDDETKRLRSLADPFNDQDDDWEPPLQTLRFWTSRLQV